MSIICFSEFLAKLFANGKHLYIIAHCTVLQFVTLSKVKNYLQHSSLHIISAFCLWFQINLIFSEWQTIVIKYDHILWCLCISFYPNKEKKKQKHFICDIIIIWENTAIIIFLGIMPFLMQMSLLVHKMKNNKELLL